MDSEETRIKTLEAENERLRSGSWEPVEYDLIYTPEGEPISPAYKSICDKWSSFNAESSDIEGKYEFAICRWQPGEPSQEAQLPDTERETTDTSWFEGLDEGFEAVYGEMSDRHLKMVFALNMVCEYCKRDEDLNMSPIHLMALFGLGYSHEEEEAGEEKTP